MDALTALNLSVPPAVLGPGKLIRDDKNFFLRGSREGRPSLDKHTAVTQTHTKTRTHT